MVFEVMGRLPEKTVLDYFTLESKAGANISIDWDESEYTWNSDGTFTATLRGIYYDSEYANNRGQELSEKSVIKDIQFYDYNRESEVEFNTIDENHCIEKIIVYDDEKIYVIEINN